MKAYNEVTDADIQEWKHKYGSVEELTIEVEPAVLDADGNVLEKVIETTFIVKQPNRTVLDVAGSHGVKKDVVGANKVLISNCVLAGDKDLLENNGSVYSTVLKTLNQLVQVKKNKLKKL